MHFYDAYDGYHDFHDNWFRLTMGDQVSSQDIFHDAIGDIGHPEPIFHPNSHHGFYNAKEGPTPQKPMQQVLQPSPQIDRMWTPYKSKSTITPILSNTSMHTPAPPLSGYTTTGDLSAVNNWLTPGTPFVAHEFPSALFPTDSDARFVTRRKKNNVPLMDLNQIQQLKLYIMITWCSGCSWRQ